MRESAMKNVLAILVLILAHTPAYADPNAPVNRPMATILRRGEVPIGSLGFPLGSCLTLEGRRDGGFKTGDQTLLIDTINGKRVGDHIGIWVENVELPPPQFRCVLKGYEMARMIGVPPAVEQAEQAGREAGEKGGDVQPGFQSDLNIPFVQAGWQVQPYFVALSHVALKDVALKSDAVAAIRSALPKGWTVKVEDDTYPPHRAAGKGKAILLRPSYRERAEAVVYLMPSDYQDGEKVSTEVKGPTSHPASVIGEVPSFKIYFWAADGHFAAGGWPRPADDILKALLKTSSSVSRSEPQPPNRRDAPNGQLQ
jgi:hypothetical protein